MLLTPGREFEAGASWMETSYYWGDIQKPNRANMSLEQVRDLGEQDLTQKGCQKVGKSLNCKYLAALVIYMQKSQAWL